MHALKKLHTALRPQGVLLDVHPLPQDSWFEVRRAGQNFAVGQVDQAQDIADITSAEVPIRRECGGICVGSLPVTLHDLRAFRTDFARLADRGFLVVLIKQFDVC